MKPTVLVEITTASALLEQVLADAGAELIGFDGACESPLSLLEGAPDCVFVDWASAAGRSLCRQIRAAFPLRNVPIIALVESVWSDEVPHVFSSGADDFVPKDQLALARPRLMAVLADGRVLGMHGQGTVVVADADVKRRGVLASRCKRMGLEVRFAACSDDIPDGPDVKLVVAHPALPPHGAVHALQQRREAGGPPVPWILAGTTVSLWRARQQLADTPQVCLFDLGSNPDQLDYLANQLLVPEGANRRQSARVPFGVACVVHAPGVESAWGYVSDLSLGGVFVRTFTPPPMGSTVKLMFHVPGAADRVQVVGTVMRRKEFSKDAAAASGFGVRFDQMTTADREALERGYRELLLDTNEASTLQLPPVRSPAQTIADRTATLRDCRSVSPTVLARTVPLATLR